MDNIEFSKEPESQPTQTAPAVTVERLDPVSPTPTQQPSSSTKLTDIPVTDENVALNIIVSFLNVAQKRGVFSFDESAKIWECIKFFTKN